MCGIFALFYHNNMPALIPEGESRRTEEQCYESFYELTSRGPDRKTFIYSENQVLGFCRLCINDLSEKGDQPFVIDDITVLCNGEIYNHKQIEEAYHIQTTSTSDCEVIGHLYKLVGIEETIKLLDGDFAFILIDSSKKEVYFGRDRIGVRPLFYSYDHKSTFN